MPFIRQLVVILPGLHRLLMLLTLIVVALGSGPVLAAEKPNILWITSEDHGPQMGCYGDRLARTPHVDAITARVDDLIIRPGGILRHREWGMYEVGIAGPDGLLVRVGWPSDLVRAG